MRSSRVLPWPRSPSSTMSWPASSARSSCGITVISKPCRPGHGSRPSRRASSRFSRSSSRRVFWPVAALAQPAEGGDVRRRGRHTFHATQQCNGPVRADSTDMTIPVRPCPCGSPSYDACCGRLHRGEEQAATPEELMRSRYSAYAVGDSDYVFRTWHPRTRPDDVDPDPSLRWTGLEVLHAEGDVVEFRAGWETPRPEGCCTSAAPSSSAPDAGSTSPARSARPASAGSARSARSRRRPRGGSAAGGRRPAGRRSPSGCRSR